MSADAAAVGAATMAATPAPNATDASKPAPAAGEAASEDEAPPDPKESLEKHVQHAVKVGKRMEAAVQHAVKVGKRKEAAKLAAETKAAKKDGKPPPATPAQPVAPVAAEGAPAAEPEKPADDRPTFGPISRQSLKQLLDAGDIDGAFKEAFGKSPGDFNINSKRWAEFNRVTRAEKNKIRVEAQRIQGEEAKVQRAAADLAAQYRPMFVARQLYEQGDYEGAIKQAFGDDVTGFNRKLISTATGAGKSPEIASLRDELKQLREERRLEKEQVVQQATQAEIVREQNQMLEQIASDCTESGDEQLARFAKKPAFGRRVFQILQQHYDPSSRNTLPFLEAADMARNEIVEEFGDVFPSRDAGVPAVSVQGGSNPAKPAAQAARTISQNGAAETSAPPRGWHGKTLEEQVREFTSKAS